ncbi:PadR family transcriptional regulator [Georgenia faecalis]|uniref:PadR family transcriptional regulator n=1 Tax=Georgenia faecalis TaxID=2483799 RepID=A0ABV9D5I6_9MICO|nr:PadR family transcriptional regulator [Georgenia faecalis]
MTEPEWPPLWVRASLDLAVLGCLLDGPLHGYGIAQRLEARGFGRLKGGSLYPALSRLEDAGHVVTTWEQGEHGPGRKDYSITDGGREYLDEGLAAWQSLTRALDPTKEHRS